MERQEKLEQLRALENGIGIRVAETDYETLGVDTPEDLEFIRHVYSRFDGRDDFTWQEVLDLVHNEPQLMQINEGVQHKTLKDVDKRALKHKKV